MFGPSDVKPSEQNVSLSKTEAEGELEVCVTFKEEGLRWKSEETKFSHPNISQPPPVLVPGESDISPTDRTHSPESLATSQEFMTADFYIDESMPSSYTESNGMTGIVKHPSLKSHHIVTAELQHQLEEKHTLINLLQVLA